MVESFQILQIPYVLAGEGVWAAADAEGGLLLRPEGHHPLCAAGKGHRPGGVAPAPPEEILPALPLHEKGIVAPVPDGPVVKQEALRDSRKPGQRLPVPQIHRPVGRVGAGHHQSPRPAGGAIQKKDVQGGIGKQDPQPVVGAQKGEGLRIPLFQQDDGPLRPLEKGFLPGGYAAEKPGGFQIPAHKGQGLFLPALAGPQKPDSLFVFGVAGQMEAPQPLHRHHLPLPQGPLGQGDGIPGQLFSPGAAEKGSGPAGGAAIRLGVVAAAAYIAVFLPAGGAHGKALHGGPLPVVGHILYDGKPGAAVRAVDEGIPVAPIPRI